MEERGAYGQQLGEVFQLHHEPAFVTRSFHQRSSRADRLSARRRAFRQSKGLAPHQCLLRRRVEQAEALLRDRTLSLSDVAILRLC